jgi:hypothetical protein
VAASPAVARGGPPRTSLAGQWLTMDGYTAPQRNAAKEWSVRTCPFGI